MSEDRLWFRMLCFHRHLVRFMVHCSATSRDHDTHGYSKPSTIRSVSFMCLLENIRTRSAACGAITRSSWILSNRWRTTYITQTNTCFPRGADAKTSTTSPLHCSHLSSFWMLTQCDSLSPQFQQCESPSIYRLWRARITCDYPFLTRNPWYCARNTRETEGTTVPPSGAQINFNGYERNMHQRHLTAEIIELIARTSIVIPTGVSKCGSHTHRSRALSGHISSLALCEVSSKHR